jgi:myo-inositol 2-dehydrogenase / D-chiro-inositol 1-dehydrogenase
MVALAFAGAGFVTAIHGLAAEALPDLRIVHVASRSNRSARRRAAQTGGIACGYDELPGGADVVVVATPPALHRREAERAVGGSAAALVEAPLAATMDDADRLVAAADRGGRVGYAENLVHSPAVVEALGACRRLGSLTHL